MNQETCVHTEHCCLKHGCKYRDENCPVALGLKKQAEERAKQAEIEEYNLFLKLKEKYENKK